MNIYELIDKMALEHKSIFDMPLRVTFYARVSTKSDEQLNSQENQIQTFTDLIKRNSKWTLIDGYVDTIRGESAANRNNFMKMIEDSKNDKFDLIVCKEISRFSRDLLDSISYTRELFKNNVGVYFTSDNLCTVDRDSELRLGIMATIAQQEVARLSERIKFGHKKSIENGVVMGNSRIYGFRKQDGKLVIDEREGKMVKRIYDLKEDRLAEITIIPMFGNNVNIGINKQKIVMTIGQITKKMLPIGKMTFKRYVVPYLKGNWGVEFTYSVNVQM